MSLCKNENQALISSLAQNLQTVGMEVGGIVGEKVAKIVGTAVGETVGAGPSSEPWVTRPTTTPTPTATRISNAKDNLTMSGLMRFSGGNASPYKKRKNGDGNECTTPGHFLEPVQVLTSSL